MTIVAKDPILRYNVNTMSALSDKPLRDEEFPDESDTDDGLQDTSSNTLECPFCGRDVYDEASVCPSCGNWVDLSPQRPCHNDKWYYRAGLWATKTLVLNWIFWIALSAISAVTIWLRWAAE